MVSFERVRQSKHHPKQILQSFGSAFSELLKGCTSNINYLKGINQITFDNGYSQDFEASVFLKYSSILQYILQSIRVVTILNFRTS